MNERIYFSLILLILSLCSCGSKVDKLNNSTGINNIKEQNHKSLTTKTLNDSIGLKSYLFENDTIYQCMQLFQINEEARFKYWVRNKRLGQTSDTISGVLKKFTDPNNNLQLGEDENGLAYSENVFTVYAKGIYFEIAIDQATKTMVTIDTDKSLKLAFPLTSIGILRINK